MPTIIMPSNKSEFHQALHATGGAPALVVFVMEGCPACTQLKRTLSQSTLRATAILLDIDKFRPLATANNITRVPTYYAIRYINGALQFSAPPQTGGDPATLTEYMNSYS